MRRLKVVFLASLFIAVAGFPAKASTFSCPDLTNFVGVVGEIKLLGGRAEIILVDPASYDMNDVGGFPKGSVSIDAASEVVRRYLGAERRLHGRPPLAGTRPRKLTVSSDSIDRADIRAGNVIINIPPPVGGCRLGGFGIFAPDGKLRAVINDGPQGSYTIGSATLESRVGKKISCKGGTCIARGIFSIDGEGAKLKPGEDFTPNSGPIKSIELIESSYPKEMEMAPGGKWKLRYVMRFE